MEEDTPTPELKRGATYREAVRQATHDSAMASIQKEQKNREEKTARLREAREAERSKAGNRSVQSGPAVLSVANAIRAKLADK